MKLTTAMLIYIQAAMDERFKESYPKTGGSPQLREKVTKATIEGLEAQPESTLSRALFLAARDATEKAEQ